MEGLGDAAVCRSESDWLVGINGTRAMTAFNSKTGGFHLTTVGRVQTPTLAIVVEREEKIREFKPRSYWEVEGDFGCAAGEYPASGSTKPSRARRNDEHARATASGTIAQAELPSANARQTRRWSPKKPSRKPATVAAALRPDQPAARSERPLRLLGQNHVVAGAGAVRKAQGADLPAYRRARLPEDYLPTVKATLDADRRRAPARVTTNRCSPATRRSPTRFWRATGSSPNKRIFNNAKISDHFAIIPTLQAPKHLNELEQKLYDLVVKRFLAVFFPAAEYLVTTRITRVEGEPFKTEGKVLVNPGWLAVYGKEAQEGDEGNLVAVEPAKERSYRRHHRQGQRNPPPARYSEATCCRPWKAPARWSTTRN
jgi:DNA topoisomerase-3